MTDSGEEQQILRILSWNVNGFNRKRNEVLRHLSLLKADIVFLQETHVGPDRIYSTGSVKIQDLECDYNMAAFTVFKGNSRGVAVLFKKNLGCGGFSVKGDLKGRFIIISCQIWGHDFVFINVYNSNEEKIRFAEFTQIVTHIPPSAYLVVGGDFNTVMDADLDKTSNLRNRSHRKSFDALQSFLETLSLVDVWRCLFPEVKSFTYFDGKGQSRLDYFFLQSSNLSSVTACKIHERPKYSEKEEYISDHAPLSIQIQTCGPKWQFDSCLLEDKACMEHLSSTIKKMSQINTRKKEYLWPGVKVRLICEAIVLQRRLKLSRCSDAIELPREVEPMDQGGCPGSESSIEVLQTPNTSSQSLLNFLNHLHQTGRFDDIKSTLITVLTEPVSRKEILVAVLSLPQSESPTEDGLTVHFYKHYGCKITDLLQAFFNQIFDLKPIKNAVFESLSQDKYDHTYSYDIQYHCSPMAIINVDHKILALILAARLNGVIKHILNPGQSKQHTSVQHCIRDQTPALIISLKLDPEALKWPYLFNSLKSVNLPDRFTSVLKLLLMTDHRSHGLRVGCPLTPLLISICLLPLVNSINCENGSLGPEVQGETLKSVINEDTALVFLSNSNEALERFEKMLIDFIETSGFIIDEQCSEVYKAGSSGLSLSKDKLKFFKRVDDGCCGVVQEKMFVDPS
ncbi:LINE-1 retrotransposable element ORF2 protein [Pseudorasbora parva]|uniref:LINE-1 retrotransposable element ORF2 protein n=1 Tax=Pseudorasbora parva TaxID=51549 RepID=UPI00351EB50F